MLKNTPQYQRKYITNRTIVIPITDFKGKSLDQAIDMLKKIRSLRDPAWRIERDELTKIEITTVVDRNYNPIQQLSVNIYRLETDDEYFRRVVRSKAARKGHRRKQVDISK